MTTRRTFIMVGLVTAAAGIVAITPRLLRRRDDPPRSEQIEAGPCSPEALGVITRAEWGALEPDTLLSYERPYDPYTNPDGWMVYEQPEQILDTIVIHHSALPLSDGPLEIQDLHMRERGFADIGYHYVIDDSGQLFEGRDTSVRGAHTSGHNTGAIGVVLLGNFEEIQPTNRQLAKLETLLKCLVQRYPIRRLAGHRDFNPGVTLCPGANLAPLLPGIAQAVGVAYRSQ